MDMVSGGSINSVRRFHNGLILANAKAAEPYIKDLTTVVLTLRALTNISSNAQGRTALAGVFEHRSS